MCRVLGRVMTGRDVTVSLSDGPVRHESFSFTVPTRVLSCLFSTTRAERTSGDVVSLLRAECNRRWHSGARHLRHRHRVVPDRTGPRSPPRPPCSLSFYIYFAFHFPSLSLARVRFHKGLELLWPPVPGSSLASLPPAGDDRRGSAGEPVETPVLAAPAHSPVPIGVRGGVTPHDHPGNASDLEDRSGVVVVLLLGSSPSGSGRSAKEPPPSVCDRAKEPRSSESAVLSCGKRSGSSVCGEVRPEPRVLSGAMLMFAASCAPPSPPVDPRGECRRVCEST
jgi:hypothetical protein